MAGRLWKALPAEGFEHQPGTASFIGPENAIFDLLGHGDVEEGDHTGGTDAPTFSDAGAQGYAPMRHQVEAGLKRLGDLLERLDA